MNYVTMLWFAAAAAALLLAIVHGFVWLYDRCALANLAFSILALSVAGIAVTEIGAMHATTPAEWGAWVRWCHLPLFVCFASELVFLRLYFGTGRPWLAGTVVGLRGVILLANFAVSPDFNFARIDSIDHIRFLGQTVTTVGDSVTSDWQWLATLSNVLFLAFIVNATVTLWRQGDPAGRRRALVVGGGILAFVIASIVLTQMVIWGLVRIPLMIAPPFLATLAAMAIELSRDTLRAAQLARALTESERRLELAAEAAGLGLWSWEVTHNELWATERARGLLGFSKDEPLDFDRWLATIHPDDADRARRAVDRAVAEGGEYAVEFRICPREGGTRWIAARGRAERDAKGRTTLMRGVVRDITDRRRIQNESEGLRRELAHAGRVTMLGQLSSALAHELSQPLGAILRNVEAAEILLQAQAPDLDELRAIVEDIHRDDRRAGEVIDRLRALLKRRSVDFQAVALDGVMHDVRTLVQADATARRVVLECAAAHGLPQVSGDRVHQTQVLMNLILNSMDALGSSNGAGRSVRIHAGVRPDRMIEVAVTDSGPGIPAEAMDRIFEPFFTTKASGMGMGLPVCRTIVQAHGGSLWAENNTGGGATFRFTLPAIEGAP